MGINKAFLEINGKPIIENIIEILKIFFDNNILINTNNPELFQKFKLKIIEDIVKEKDIFGGFYSILKSIDTDYSLIVPCDMPFIEKDLVKLLLNSNFSNYDIVTFKIKNKFQPLFGIYKKTCIDFFEKAIKNEHFPKLIELFINHSSLILEEKDIPDNINIDKAFFNINTEEDYYKAKKNCFKEIPIIGIVAKYSKSGKTTLIENLIKLFKKENFKVGVIKHTVHKIEIDKKGKDSYRFFESGADTVLIDTKDELALRKRLAEPQPVKYLRDKFFSDVDIVIVEGHKGGNFPKIEIIKDEQKDFLYLKDKNIIAIIGNKFELSNREIKFFKKDEIHDIYNFIKNSLNLKNKKRGSSPLF